MRSRTGACRAVSVCPRARKPGRAPCSDGMSSTKACPCSTSRAICVSDLRFTEAAAAEPLQAAFSVSETTTSPERGGGEMTQTPCMTVTDADVFFPETNEQLAVARSLCGRCPVSATCLEHALTLGVTDGVWGGK